MSDPKKVELASPEWYELATKILAEVAQECGEDDFQLSVCEVFIDAPKDVDLYMQGSWDPADARRIYTPDFLEEQAKNPTPPEDPNLAIEGDMERLPPWIIEFHNRLAPYTA